MNPTWLVTTQHRKTRYCRAFTLLEVLVVVVVMALIATSATFSFRKPMQNAAQADAIQQLRDMDLTTRQAAMRFNRPMQISFDLAEQNVSRVENSFPTRTIHLPRGIRLTELRTAALRIFDSQHSVNISESGIGSTYAVHLTGNQFDRWILFSGMTGEMSGDIHEQNLDNIFTVLATQRARRADTD